jgi:pilus assembly protein CpaE
MVVGHENDISLYRDLISRGVSDYVVAPIDPLGFIRQVSALYNGQNKETLGRVIAVVGAKGGVGASTISHNLAWSISRELNLQTIIADLDLPFGTAGLDFNQDPPQGIAEAVFSPERLDANFMDRLLSKCSDTLNILAAPVSIDRSYDLSEQSFEVLLDILRDTSPAVVLDVPHQWSGWTRRVLVGADEVAIVVTPDLANLRNAKILMDSLRTARPNDMSPHIIINMTGVPKRPEIPIADFAKAMELTPLGTIPFDPKLFGTATNNGQMLAEVEASSNIVATIDDMGQQLMGRGGSRRIKKKTLLGPLFRRFGVVKAG